MNTNNPDYVKHAKAALASKAEMDKWKMIEIIDAIAAVLSLGFAWLASSWMIAIAGIVICGGVGAYATSQKEKAKQDTLDHMNRADGMSESLVGATRGRREAENALAGAISQLDSASSKLRSASTYDEKRKAEAEVVSAQAAIESAKLRLQQATTREASESQRSQQQALSDVEQTNQSSPEPLDTGFSGEKVLTNDGYKIYLVKKHKIEKNDVLGKFVCSERLFDSIDEALVFADSLEGPVSGALSIPEVPEIPELIDGMNELRSNPAPDGDNASNNEVHKTIAPKNNTKKILKGIAAVVFLGALIAYMYTNFNSGKSQQAQSSQVSKLTDKSYRDYRNEILKAGWSPYIRTNQIQGWSREYPELQFCYEDNCEVAFINADKTKVRKVDFGYCSTDSYIKCPGKPNGFQKVYKDIVMSKAASDKDFRSLMEKFGD
jgi:hypothetical protein